MQFSSQDKVLSIAPHIIALLPIPPFNILIVYIYRMTVAHQSPLIENHTRANLNFQISFQLYTLIGFLIMFAIGGLSSITNSTIFDFPPLLTIIGVGTSFFIMGGLIIQWFVMVVLIVIAIIKAAMGKYHKFPLTIQIIK